MYYGIAMLRSESMSKEDTESRQRVAIPVLDLEGNRAARKYSRREQLQRVLWAFGQWAFRLSPRPMFAWRRSILRLFGAEIGHAVNMYPSTRIYMPWNLAVADLAALGENVFIYNLGKVSIGRGATISYRAHICAGSHDFSQPTLPLVKPPVTIADYAWIGTDAFIGPGVTVGGGAIVGARAVVVKDVAPLHIVAGNPARTIGIRPGT
jgi:putative colanic acid biosynthesis acetyltransferase WcaF